MKKFSLFAFAAAGLLLGACSSDNDDVKVAPASPFSDGAYIGISIQMPSTDATRANEDFDDGETAEWEVKDANLIIFTGSSEADATYVATYAMETAVLDEPENDNVTATINKATQIDNDLADEITNSEEAVKYFAYVIVNANGQVPTLTENTTFAAFKALEFNAIGSPIAEECNIGAGGLLMTNAPVSAAPGGAEAAPITADNYSTLVEIDKTKIFSSAALAQKAGNEAACVYVERAAVKVTVKANEEGVENNTGMGDITIDGWQIINYEPTYFNTRQIEAAWGDLASDIAPALQSPYLYRFVSPNKFTPNIPSAHTGPYRTYWAKDVNYDNGTALSKPQADISATAKWIAMGKSGYTTENTFDVEHQTWENTTQITVKVTFAGGNFFIVDGNDGKLDLANAKTQLEKNIKSLLPVQNAFQELVKNLPALEGGVYSLNVTVSMDEPTEGKNKVPYTAAVKVMNGANEVNIPSDFEGLMTALEDAVENGTTIYNASYYLKGESYYNARIQHFGEVETPWSASAPWKVIEPGTTVQQIYGFGNSDANIDGGEDLSAQRFLGRYGVVRDNWYVLTVDVINELGSAEPIDVTGNGTPDDEVKNYMSVHVHIVPWVLREQHISF